MLGVQQGKVRLEQYNLKWKEDFEIEKKKLESLIGKYVIKIEHIGSTAIPGLYAKPIIDIAIIVKELKDENQYIKILKDNGYEFRDDNGIKGEHLFKKKNKRGLTTHFLHVIEENGIRYNNYTLFKKYLLKHAEEIEKYNTLKMSLIEKYKNNREEYTKAKEKYILNIINKCKKEKKMGLNRLDVKLDNYNEEWKEKFEEEKRILKDIFKEDAIQIEHVGSTAIPGLKAKPIIDISIGVKELDIALKHIEEMEKVGYSFRGNAGVEGRYFFAKGPEDNRTHYIHVEPINSANWETHVLFKKYLLENPKIVEEYQKIKEELAKKYPNDRKKYTSGKNDFIQSVLEKAREKYKNDKNNQF